jgi:uncharacterized membrane protein
MDTLTVFALAFAIGIVAGLRTMTAPAAVSWAARLKWIDLENTGLAFLGYAATPYIFSVLALAEWVNDKLPKTPSRKAPGPFIGRIVFGAFSGAALCSAGKQSPVIGALVGGLGAVAGTLGGYEARTRLVKALHVPDFVIALLEDALAICSGLFLVSRFRS